MLTTWVDGASTWSAASFRLSPPPWGRQAILPPPWGRQTILPPPGDGRQFSLPLWGRAGWGRLAVYQTDLHVAGVAGFPGHGLALRDISQTGHRQRIASIEHDGVGEIAVYIRDPHQAA